MTNGGYRWVSRGMQRPAARPGRRLWPAPTPWPLYYYVRICCEVERIFPWDKACEFRQFIDAGLASSEEAGDKVQVRFRAKAARSMEQKLTKGTKARTTNGVVVAFVPFVAFCSNPNQTCAEAGLYSLPATRCSLLWLRRQPRCASSVSSVSSVSQPRSLRLQLRHPRNFLSGLRELRGPKILFVGM